MRAWPRTLLWMAAPFALATAAAYAQWAIVGLPPAPSAAIAHATGQPQGFPAWLRIGHYLNFLLLTLLVRSGVQILMDHPRLYWNVHCTPGTEWVRFTPIAVPRDRPWTSKDDARYVSPWIGLPGGRHTLGLARHWHFSIAVFWVANGLLFYLLLFATGQWRRIVPDTWQVVPDAWAVFVHYATLHLPPEPDGFYRYNALQQLAYFAAVFVLAPASIVTGPSMSPALVNRFRWYPRLPGNRQIGRSVHFVVLCLWLFFVAGHVTMVVLTGALRNMNHIVLGSDDGRLLGAALGSVGIGGVAVACWLANRASRVRPRAVQHAASRLIDPILSATLDRHAPRAEYTKEDISPFFWPNGKMPTSPEWRRLADGGFTDYRLKVYGLVEHPAELSLDELRAMGTRVQITLHHCIQGWSGIAAWGGLPMRALMERVRPRPEATAVVFYSFGEGGEGGRYYDSHSLENVRHPQAMLAYEMNFGPLGALHGAPLRLRVENQLGYKMVKWISAIEFVADVRRIYAGEGGYNEDNEFFDSMADI
ncbi:MAG: molybdopterin-dependent oxidoreductase [Deltaproteobacteria bacterium]|nr:molybdopterin-dependent oxidoreductase [Deltaproteobacteria bacterium]